MKKKDILPPPASLRRRVLDALYQHRAGIIESALMDAHGTNGMAPTMWRQGPYRSLSFAGLIEHVDGFNNSRRWRLTLAGRALMLDERAQQLQGSESQPVALRPAPPRQAPEFRPLDPGYYSHAPHRDGAWDFKAIPSVFSDRQVDPKCA